MSSQGGSPGGWRDDKEANQELDHQRRRLEVRISHQYLVWLYSGDRRRSSRTGSWRRPTGSWGRRWRRWGGSRPSCSSTRRTIRRDKVEVMLTVLFQHSSYRTDHFCWRRLRLIMSLQEFTSSLATFSILLCSDLRTIFLLSNSKLRTFLPNFSEHSIKTVHSLLYWKDVVTNPLQIVLNISNVSLLELFQSLQPWCGNILTPWFNLILFRFLEYSSFVLYRIVVASQASFVLILMFSRHDTSCITGRSNKSESEAGLMTLVAYAFKCSIDKVDVAIKNISAVMWVTSL